MLSETALCLRVFGMEAGHPSIHQVMILGLQLARLKYACPVLSMSILHIWVIISAF